MKKFLIIFFLFALWEMFAQSHKVKVLRRIVHRIHPGEIWESVDSTGKIIFFISANAYDAQEEIYRLTEKKKIGFCNYFSGELCPLCRYRNKATLIYRAKNHINGQPPVDVYHLNAK